MKVSQVINSKKLRIGLLILSVFGLTYVILRLLVFDYDPILPFFRNFFYNWLGLNEKFASIIINAINLPYSIENHSIVFQGQSLYEFSPIFLARKWFFGLLLLIWLFPVKLKDKFIGSIALITLHFFITSIDVVILVSRATIENVTDHSAYLVARTPLVLLMISFFSFWILRYRDKIYPALEKFNVNIDFIERKLPELFVILYLYGFLSNFILGWFDYYSWINFLFVSSQSILEIFNYQSEVYLTYLIGENGSIYMEKGCLGFGTMALFAAVVYLTADETKGWWIYMIAGIIFLNFVNILRFVFLFIHIQNNSGYALAIDVHDMYNIILYAVVFILWVIWFEMFALKNTSDKNKLILSKDDKD